ncbi:MAG: C40 family peptidase [Nitrospira sp.]|nr:C40 family peptidase [Nitrospira sp.]
MIDDLIGTPYVPGGRLPGSGTDCFGLVVACCLRAGHPIPDPFVSADRPMDSREWIAERLGGWQKADGPTPGGIVELHSLEHPAHIGFMLSDTEFLHTTRKTGAIISRIDRAPWKQRVIGWYVYAG